jgi:hypothetical protein
MLSIESREVPFSNLARERKRSYKFLISVSLPALMRHYSVLKLHKLKSLIRANILWPLTGKVGLRPRYFVSLSPNVRIMGVIVKFSSP